MKLQLYVPDGRYAPWIEGFAEALPEAQCVTWEDSQGQAVDYAVVWRPPLEMLKGRQDLKAVFNLGAGVDGILRLRDTDPDALPAGVPIVRLDDAGMGAQMAEYVTHAVLRYFRRLDDYAAQQHAGTWKFLKPNRRADFTIGVMGVGTLGAHIARTLASFGFPVRGWSRSPKTVDGVQCHAGEAGQAGFLDGLRVLVNVLPLTPETENIIDAALLNRLAKGAYLINVARGPHLVEEDLLAAVQQGQIAGATLDVFRTEPLPPEHPFWREPRITITPHISALTLREDSIAQIADKIRALRAGKPIAGVVDLQRGY
ncbi:glyoxylate/hydroxypyruvate reductase A [Cupriavidus gilardii]|uniref:2-hydroxyacid dehydrogenase n=1 Tax=Cupriavidus gilardii TaxID=82541 RepID=UPI001EE56A1B|nr:glyoxylate/hydroxypyruvate reductase A [Cupriavidus gilardii]MCG5259422.1 glyoxylate/hydroxypyruvate reductase A [Cupriavidus gilardii]MDF9432164.1 glyoxylate/hydroxypyruvate reductase A [Cupriavidus gilardii]